MNKAEDAPVAGDKAMAKAAKADDKGCTDVLTKVPPLCLLRLEKLNKEDY